MLQTIQTLFIHLLYCIMLPIRNIKNAHLLLSILMRFSKNVSTIKWNGTLFFCEKFIILYFK